ncbi:hypothetical protein [Streptomyces sp. NBC_01429]|uniref:hypothetical protein n=1 Tax=Streptomyces sp. NBC_01429 TaxID=2903862 RepID=UPI002E28ED55|nr:hypothetical protein [Streptomyces sp. NBC_01429]
MKHVAEWRFLPLFARARNLGRTAAAAGLLLIAPALAGDRTVRTGIDTPITLPLAVLVPAALATVIGAGTHEAMPHLDRLSNGRVVRMRARYGVLTLLVAGAGTWLMTPAANGAPDVLAQGPEVAVRNLAALTGLALACATVLGAELSWPPAVLLLGAALFLGRTGTAAPLWSWLTAPPGDPAALTTACALTATGIGLYVPYGDGGLRHALLRA